MRVHQALRLQYYLDSTDVARLAPFFGLNLFGTNLYLNYLYAWHESVPKHLYSIDCPANRLPSGFDEHVFLATLEEGHASEYVVEDWFSSDVNCI